MAWSFSHSQSAYDNLRANLYTLDLEILREVYANWVAYEVGIAIAMLQDPDSDNIHSFSSEFNPDIYDWLKDDCNDTYKDRTVIRDCGLHQMIYGNIAGLLVTHRYSDTCQANPATVDLTSVESLSEAIYSRVMCELGRTCDNGGFNAWIDPQGYHELSFDLVEGAELEY